MDADHRHELHENDLAVFLANFGEWWNKHGNTVLTVLLIAVVVYAGKTWYQSSQAKAHEAAWSDLANATSPGACQSVAESHSDPAVRALAYLRAGDLLLKKASQLETQAATEALTGDKPDESQAGDEGEDASGQDPDPSDFGSNPGLTASGALETAQSMFRRVVQDDSANPIYRLNALLGLAAVAEGLENWDEAGGHYQSVLDQAGAGYEAISSQARTRLDMIDQLKTPVIFASEPPPPPPGQDVLDSILTTPLDTDGIFAPPATAPDATPAPDPEDSAASQVPSSTQPTTAPQKDATTAPDPASNTKNDSPTTAPTPTP